ncbi:MAG: TetR/AcrR family transcriptional regulator [Gluconacetobacter diazotrophicus]|nr:TetR/AcrR family transcriptional regulator [Gluconacetobacter diazotrophicus]
MGRAPDISLKKQAKQSRSVATVAALVEAATYILREEGPRGFTANKVAERAGVNIASFYQYYPNKQALLFHVARLEWERQLERLSPILTRPGADHADKLRDFICEFFLIEAAEADLRRALRIAAIDLRETAEFGALIAQGAKLMREFLEQAVPAADAAEIDVAVSFIVPLVTSFAERLTDQGISEPVLRRHAGTLSTMLIAQYGMR